MKPNSQPQHGITNLLETLFPCLNIQQITADTNIIIEAHIGGLAATCPYCQSTSSRVHSYYTRSPRDLPLAGISVRLLLKVRRFRCTNGACPATTFAERIPEFLAAYAQRTVRLTQTLTELGLVLGGEAAARQSQRQGMPVSAATLLRFARQYQLPNRTTPSVLGVDDFALRKGRVYGTVLVDGETHQPVDLLPERSAETFREWLQSHPGVEIITRDRSREYARAATEGAPDALQVADRWHLLVNLREAVERLLDRVRPQLKAQIDSLSSEITPYDRETQRGTLGQARQELRRTKRLNLYKQVKALHAQGTPILRMAKQLGISRQTVRLYINSETFPEIPRHARRKSILDPYVHYLQQRWDAGYHNTNQLWSEIQQQGFTGSVRAVVQWTTLRRERLSGGHSGKGRKPARNVDGQISSRSSVLKLPASRQLVWLLVHHPDKLGTTGLAKRDDLLRCPEIRATYPIIQTFFSIVRERQAEKLADWISACCQLGIAELTNFAKGLQQELDIVLAALSTSYSNGLTEGHVNRLKLIKRSMYGRANFDLLRIRVLAQL